MALTGVEIAQRGLAVSMGKVDFAICAAELRAVLDDVGGISGSAAAGTIDGVNTVRNSTG